MPRKPQALGGSDDLQPIARAASATAHAEAPELKQDPEFHASDLDIVTNMDAAALKVREEKFMNEKVEIQIEMDDSPDAPVFVMLGHNGISQWVKRGEPQVVKRKFLYSAFAAKTLRYACSFGKENSGKEFNRMSASVNTAYRVQLLRDDNPQGGMKWLRSVAALA